MKAFFLFTGSGPLVILTSHGSVQDPVLLGKLSAKGIDKFIAHELSVELARQRYAKHFDIVSQDLSESDDLRVLDYNGDRAFRLFHFDEMGPALQYEAQPTAP